MAKQQRKPATVTPIGSFSFAWLTKPDTKFDAKGKYQVTVTFPAKDAVKLVQQLDREHAEGLVQTQAEVTEKNAKAKAEGKKGFKPKKVIDAGAPYVVDEDTGDVTVKFSMNAERTDKKTGETVKMAPKLFDKHGTLLKDPKVGNGTTGRISFTTNPYYVAGTEKAGLSLYMSAVQIIDLVEWGGGGNSASGYGFSVEENDEPDDDSSEFTSVAADDTDDTAADEF